MADPKINKCDPSLNLTCDELFRNNCITAEENQFCEDEWHLEMDPAPADEFISTTVDKTPTASIKFNSLFSTAPIEEQVCYDDSLEADFFYYNNVAEGVCEEFDFKLYESFIPKSTLELDKLLRQIKELDNSLFRHNMEYMK